MTDPQTTDLFVPPAAEGLPPAALDSATEGADRLDAYALTPTGRNLLAHALVQLARDGWLRAEPGEGFEPMRDREQPAAAPPTDRAGLRDLVAEALYEARRNGLGGMSESAAVTFMANAVVRKLPPPADRAAVLREAADAVFALDYDVMVGEVGDENFGSMREAWDVGTIHATELLRRLAAETAGPETQGARCGCPHPADEHSIYGCADGCGCEWMPKRTPVRHAPGIAVLCPDCRAKGHTVCCAAAPAAVQTEEA